MTTAVVLARGLGKRMQAADPSVTLQGDAAAAAASGVKTLVPDARGRPLIDHILTSMADAGIGRVVMVVAPDHETIASHLRLHPPRRLSVEFAVQREPLGTADAVLAAEELTRTGPFLVANADNLYPVAALRLLLDLGSPGLIGFDREALVAGGIPAERVSAFGLIRSDADGDLVELVEKPDETEMAAMGDDAMVSMNLWRFDDGIFEACREVPLSSRGERELPQAVAFHLSLGGRYRVLPFAGPVFDLSRRGDISSVGAALAAREVST